MPLSDDQRALLRLLARRDEGYEDIAALKGLSVEQVRSEVQEALAELEAAGEVQAPPPPREPEPAPEPNPVPEPEPAPEPTPAAAAAEPTPKPRAVAPGLAALPPERRRVLAIAGGALGVLAIALIVFALVGGSDSGSGGSSAAAGNADTILAESAAATDKRVTRAVLEPVDGGDAEGLAIFGRSGKQVRLGVAARNMEAAPQGQAYIVWLADKQRMVPVTPVSVNGDGEIAVQQQIPAEVLLYLAGGVFDEIDITLVDAQRYRQAVTRAQRQNKLPGYSGEDVLRGKISGPIVNAAKRAQRQQSR